MLTIVGKGGGKFCDGVSRRDFLKIGGLAMGGLSLPELLRAEAQAGIIRSHKAVIMIFLAGGPPHQDMFDIKVNAPAEIRGPFQPIKTNVPGIEICELLPRMASMMDKLVPIRSIVGSTGTRLCAADLLMVSLSKLANHSKGRGLARGPSRLDQTGRLCDVGDDILWINSGCGTSCGRCEQRAGKHTLHGPVNVLRNGLSDLDSLFLRGYCGTGRVWNPDTG